MPHQRKPRKKQREPHCPIFVRDRALFIREDNGTVQQLHWCELPPLADNALYSNGFSCDVCGRDFDAVPFWHSNSADCCKDCAMQLRIETKTEEEKEKKILDGVIGVGAIWLPSTRDDVVKRHIVCGYSCQRRVLCLLHRSGDTAVALQNEQEDDVVKFWSMRSTVRVTAEHRTALGMSKKRSAPAKSKVVVRLLSRSEFDGLYPYFSGFFETAKAVPVVGLQGLAELPPNRLPEIITGCSFELLWTEASAEEEVTSYAEPPKRVTDAPGSLLFLHSNGGVQASDLAAGNALLVGGPVPYPPTCSFEQQQQQADAALVAPALVGLHQWARDVLSLLENISVE